MPVMRYQPQGLSRLAQPYRDLVASGWLATASGYTQLGPQAVAESTRFAAIKYNSVTPNGYALSSDSASDAGTIANIYMPAAPTRNNFTLAGIFRVRAVTGAGVGVRSGTNDIFVFRTSGNYALRINNVNLTGPAFPLNTDLHYVLTSNLAGISLCVNGVEVIRGAATASAVTTGTGVDLFEDPRNGGGMNMDANLFMLFNGGISREAALALSSNLYQVFRDPEEDDYVAAGTASVEGPYVAALDGAGLAAQGVIIAAGQFSSSLANASLMSGGSVGGAPSGAFASVMSGANMAGAGAVLNRGALSSALSGAGLAANGVVATNASGSFAATLDGAELFASGYPGKDAPPDPVRPYRWRVMRRHFSNPGTQ